MSNYYSNGYDEYGEIQQAIAAGERALDSLQEADVALAGASTWGLFDIFGGNFLSGMVKHSRIKDARYHLEARPPRSPLAFRRSTASRHLAWGAPPCPFPSTAKGDALWSLTPASKQAAR